MKQFKSWSLLSFTTDLETRPSKALLTVLKLDVEENMFPQQVRNPLKHLLSSHHKILPSTSSSSTAWRLPSKNHQWFKRTHGYRAPAPPSQFLLLLPGMTMELPVIPAPNLSAPAKVGSTGTSTLVQSSVSFIVTYILVTQYASSKEWAVSNVLPYSFWLCQHQRTVQHNRSRPVQRMHCCTDKYNIRLCNICISGWLLV